MLFNSTAYLIMQHIESAIGNKITGQLDKTGSGAIYTDAFVARYCTWNIDIVLQ